MTKQQDNKGFSLIELIVSITITAILMLGMSVFFSSTMHNMFSAQERLTNTQGQFVVNDIIRDKFANLEKLIALEAVSPPTYAVIQNKITKGQLPFTYIGKNGDKLAFKDFFVFNDVETEGGTIYYGDSGAGAIKLNGTAVVSPPANFAGFAKKAGADIFYVALPFENKVVECTSTDCGTDIIIGLNSPMDVEKDGDNLYISDSGNNRVIKFTLTGSSVTELAKDLNFPTGLAVDGTNLFVADTLNNQIKKIDFSDIDHLETSVIAGEGDDDTCDSSALYCKLDLPTGLVVDGAAKALYIADTGNNRILKMWDSGALTNTEPIAFKTAAVTTTISKIKYTFSNFTLVAGSAQTDPHTSNCQMDIPNSLIGCSFTAHVTGSETEIGSCSGDGCTPPTYLKKLTVDNINFANPDIIVMDNGHTYNVVFIEGVNKIVLQTPNDGITYSDNTAKLDTSWPKDTEFILTADLSSATNSFIGVMIEVFNNDNQKIQTEHRQLRNGDGTLGTDEDQIQVSTTGLKFPTGIGLAGTPSSLIVANSFDNKVQNLTFPAVVGSIAPFSTAITNFDYTSDFEIENLSFSKLGDILEAQITAVIDDQTAPVTTQTYTFDAKI